MNGTVEAGMTTAFGKVMPVQIVEFDGPWAAIITAGGTRATVKRSSLKEAPAPERTLVQNRDRVTEVGMYNTGTDIYKVQAAKESGNLYAKRLVPIGGQRLSENDERVRWEFQYAAGAIRDLKPEQRMTLEAAKAFGIKFGVCCVCGAFLKDATSVANGIGPVCAGRL